MNEIPSWGRDYSEKLYFRGHFLLEDGIESGVVFDQPVLVLYKSQPTIG